jgi:hypothetical protein
MDRIRTVTVRSPSMLRETGAVLNVVVQIVFWTAVVTSLTWNRTGDAAKPKLEIDEVAFASLAPADQRMFRASLEGLGEAEDVRSRTRTWPTVEALAARGIPPFAADPLDRAGYAWRMLRDGTLINYIGTPAASAGPTFVISVLEPDPGTAPDPQVETDESHHRLGDGTMLHVSIWTGSRTLGVAMATPPFEDGWRRITMLSPEAPRT